MSNIYFLYFSLDFWQQNIIRLGHFFCIQLICHGNLLKNASTGLGGEGLYTHNAQLQNRKSINLSFLHIFRDSKNLTVIGYLTTFGPSCCWLYKFSRFQIMAEKKYCILKNLSSIFQRKITWPWSVLVLAKYSKNTLDKNK